MSRSRVPLEVRADSELIVFTGPYTVGVSRCHGSPTSQGEKTDFPAYSGQEAAGGTQLSESWSKSVHGVRAGNEPGLQPVCP